MLKPTFKINRSEFDKTIAKCIAASKRTIPEVVNSHAYHVVKNAMENTPIASRGQIQQAMGAEMTSQRIVKGKVRRTYKYSPRPFVYALVNAKQRKLGLKPLFQNDMAKAARKFIASKLRAVGTLKNGWLGALRTLGRAVRQSAISQGPRVKTPSTAKPATEGMNALAEIEYRLNIHTAHESLHIDPRVVEALDKAMTQETQSMQRHLETKMKDAMRAAGATVS